jgi:Ca2+-binding EF-hand superfamily protein
LPWNTWFRVVGGRQEQGLSLQLFRHLLRRRTKISNSAVPDQDVRRVFDLIDVKRVGYIRLEDFITWLNGAKVERMGGKIRVGEESYVSATTIQLGGAQDDVIDVTVTL